jgi:predicted Zn finger-like uncharacterized protein
MIVACPACRTRYLVDDAVLGGEAGRRVRCASCGNLWRHSPDAVAIQTALADAAAGEAAIALSPTTIPAPVAPALRAEPGNRPWPHPVGPTALARPSVAVEPLAAARRRSARFRGLGLIVLAAVAVLVAILAGLR